MVFIVFSRDSWGFFVVDLALNQAAKPWVSPKFRSFLVPSVADCFRTCIGDRSATLGQDTWMVGWGMQGDQQKHEVRVDGCIYIYVYESMSL